MVLKAQSTTKDYIRAEHKLHTVFKLFISQVIIPQVMFVCLFVFSLFIFRGHSTQELDSGRVTYFILRAYTESLLPQPTQKKSGEVLEKMQVNGPEV